MIAFAPNWELLAFYQTFLCPSNYWRDEALGDLET